MAQRFTQNLTLYPHTAFTLMMLYAEGKLELTAAERHDLLVQLRAQMQAFESLHLVKSRAEAERG